jgi:proteic killer suppression protein
MIVSIRHKGLRLLWVKNDPSKLPAGNIDKIRNLLVYLNRAVKISDMDLPGVGLHPLKGHLKGFWSLSVTGNYRLIFEFRDGDAYLVDYIDYH